MRETGQMPLRTRIVRLLLHLVIFAAAVLAALAAVMVLLGSLGIIDLDFLIRIIDAGWVVRVITLNPNPGPIPLYGQGLIITVAATAVMLPLSFTVGFLVGWGRISGNHLAYWTSTLFVEVLRGTPQLIVLMVGFFVILPLLVGPLELSGLTFLAGTTSLALHSAAYQAEIFRNGFQSVPSGQIEAAHALGLDSWQTMRGVIFPQAFRVSLPPLGNEFANIVKDSALISLIGLLTLINFKSFDLTGWGKQIQQLTFDVNTAVFNWVLVAVIYFILIYILTAIMLEVERSVQVPGMEEAI